MTAIEFNSKEKNMAISRRAKGKYLNYNYMLQSDWEESYNK